jgi:predicted metal-dependent hydrolase
VNVQKISVKNNLRSRWTSLTKSSSINFNVHLIKASEDVVDYIVLHEVCHLKIKGHSHHYWDLLYRYMPNYQEKIDWLNVNGGALTA